MPTIPARLRIGTRGSPLARAQTRLACGHLAAHAPALAAPGAMVEVVIRTTGDRVLDRPLAEIGGKGLFTKEIDEALLAGNIDLAVHSVKDLPTVLPAGIVLACVLPRGDVRDCLIATARRLDDLPPGAVIGTASLRRQAQVLHRRPDLRVIPLRGNVATRLARLESGVCDATLLAAAGLDRLGLADPRATALDPSIMLPAVGQAAIGLACRAGDTVIRDLLVAASDAATAAAVTAERAMLAVLDGSCRTPIAGHARLLPTGRLELCGLIARPDGSAVIADRLDGDGGDAEAIGHALGRVLKERAGPGFLAP